jgi:hypothetical protein
MDRRAAKRVWRRLTCELRFDDRKTTGIVLNVSTSGIFVQTSARPLPGTIAEVRFAARGNVPAMNLRARVARQKRVEPRLATIEAAGVGLQLLDVPEAYWELISEL